MSTAAPTPTLSTAGGLAFAISVILGSGALALPGIVFAEAGSAALWSWFAGAALMVPILYVIYKMEEQGSRTAGIHEIVGAGLGPVAEQYVHLLLGFTFGIGIPGITLITARYLLGASGAPVTMSFLAACALLGVILVILLRGTQTSSAFQVLTTTLTLITIVPLLVVAVLAHQGSANRLTAPTTTSVTAIATCFFAFAGWEMVTFIRRDLKGGRPAYRSILVGSWIIVCGLYVLVAYGQQKLSGVPEINSLRAPSAEVGLTNSAVFGLAFCMMLASLLGNVYGFCKVTATLSDRFTTMTALTRQPLQTIAPVAWIACVCSLALGNPQVGDTLLAAAGASFLIVYLLACLASLRVVRGRLARVAALIPLVAGGVIIVLKPGTLALPITALGLFALLRLASRARRRRVGALGPEEPPAPT